MTLTHRIFVLLGLLFASAGFGSAQVTTGTPPFSSAAGGPEAIDLANLNAHWTIPILSKLGRGSNFTYDLSYDSSVWYPASVSGVQTWQPVSNLGWTSSTAPVAGHLTNYYGITGNCFKYTQVDHLPPVGIPQEFDTTYRNWTFYDHLGSSHTFSGTTQSWTSSPCRSAGSTSLTSTASDGSGFTLLATGGSGQVYDSKGTLIGPPINAFVGAGTLTDRNGNIISVDGSGNITDTLGTVALVVAGSGTSSSPVTFTYTAPSGANASYTANYTNYTVATNFGVSGISEYLSSAAVPLISSIVLPDGTQYTFTYEATPSMPSSGACTPYAGTTCVTGRLASITLPTGGTLSYTYTGGNNGILPDGSAATLTRTTPDGTWTYAQVKGSGAASTTTVTDPQGNQTAVQFQGIYETQRQISQLVSGSQVILETINTCYNGSSSPCAGTAVALPITQRQIRTTLSGGLQSEHDDFWNTNGGATESEDYDYGTAPHGTLLSEILATYASLGNITAFRQTVTVLNGSGATVSKVNYNYDGTAVTATSGTPQLTSVSGSRGNLTSTNTYTTSGAFLTQSATYYDTGNVIQSTDVNGGVTTYNYASGAASCYNSFPTSITEAVGSLSTSATWNCTGGVQLTSTDPNGQTTTTSYTDSYFWRPASITDPTGAVTNYCYGTLSTSGVCSLNSNQTEISLPFNSGSSAADTLTNLDGLGRRHLTQTRQAPSSSNFDTVETDYDSLGRVVRVTLPYTGTAGQTNSTVAATTTTYDAMSRPLTVTDGGGGTTTYFYGNPSSQNIDTLVTRGPAPTGENVKQRQFEYDSLNRIKSVCEVTAGTSAWPGGTCAQNAPHTGYWTQYTLDPMGNLLTVTQNAQASTSLQQTRTYAYDLNSRLTSETVPEIGASGGGTESYTYDSDATCGSYAGDLVKKVDAAGDVICMTYDLLHRHLTTTYPSGVYASVTPSKHFVYDAATINTSPTPTAMTNVKGRLAEAYTCMGTCSALLTDIGMSYTVRGETSDVYELTPNSGGFYYHTNQTYWANGTPLQLTGNLGLPTTLTYGTDGEGRPYTVSASSGQNPVSATTYNAAGLPTSLSLGSGSGDADTFSWDPNTNRMTQYRFTVNSASFTGALAWNANATLQTQNITDAFSSTDTQSCSYNYDDVTRLAAANCGSAAAQTFSYDPFGNINKSGSPYSFQPTYAPTTNRIASLPGGFTPMYDADGNVTNDTFHSYTWDADGHAITIDAGLSDAVSITYDALGRMAEQNRSGAYTQVAYSTIGQKFALMNGTTLLRAIVPLPGSAEAVYGSSGLLYYAHPDFLGTVRLATTPSEGTYFDTAYAPFGETYATTGTLEPFYTGQVGDTAHRQDTAGGLYDFPIREYSIQGRWPNPDPMGKAAACPKDPQTQDRYAYVRNNPMSYTDPTGGFLFAPVPDIFGGDGGESPCFYLSDDLLGDYGTQCGSFFWFLPPIFSNPPNGGGGGAPHTNSENPSPFPWPVLLEALEAAQSNSGTTITANCELDQTTTKPSAGSCRFLCTNVGGGGTGGGILFARLTSIQKACPPPRSQCPQTVQITIPIKSDVYNLEFGSVRIVPNSCTYKPQ